MGSKGAWFGAALGLGGLLQIANLFLVAEERHWGTQLVWSAACALVVLLYPVVYWLCWRRRGTGDLSRADLVEIGESAYPLGYVLTLFGIFLAILKVMVSTNREFEALAFLQVFMLKITTSITGLLITVFFRLQFASETDELGEMAVMAVKVKETGAEVNGLAAAAKALTLDLGDLGVRAADLTKSLGSVCGELTPIQQSLTDAATQAQGAAVGLAAAGGRLAAVAEQSVGFQDKLEQALVGLVEAVAALDRQLGQTGKSLDGLTPAAAAAATSLTGVLSPAAGEAAASLSQRLAPAVEAAAGILERALAPAAAEAAGSLKGKLEPSAAGAASVLKQQLAVAGDAVVQVQRAARVFEDAANGLKLVADGSAVSQAKLTASVADLVGKVAMLEVIARQAGVALADGLTPAVSAATGGLQMGFNPAVLAAANSLKSGFTPALSESAEALKDRLARAADDGAGYLTEILVPAAKTAAASIGGKLAPAADRGSGQLDALAEQLARLGEKLRVLEDETASLVDRVRSMPTSGASVAVGTGTGRGPGGQRPPGPVPGPVPTAKIGSSLEGVPRQESSDVTPGTQAVPGKAGGGWNWKRFVPGMRRKP